MTRSHRWRQLWSFETLILAYGSWTIGYWLALPFELGWAYALAFTLVAVAALSRIARPWDAPPGSPHHAPPDGAAMLLVLAVVIAWPMAMELGRATLGAIALGCLAIRLTTPVLLRSVGRAELTLVILSSVALSAAIALAISWLAMVVVLSAVAVAVLVRPQLVGSRSWSPDTDRTPRVEGQCRVSRRITALVPGAVLAAFGVLIAVWQVGVSWWSSDNAGYLNKALHAAASPWSFSDGDHMFGVGARSAAPGPILSSFEPLLGATSAMSGLSVNRLLFQLVVPTAMFLLPFAIRYAARGVGIRRPNLAGAFGAAAVLLMTGTATASLFAQASYGKTMAALLGMPLVIGCAGELVRRHDPAVAVRTTLAAISTVGLSPSLGTAVLLVLGPFTAAAAWASWSRGAETSRPQLSATSIVLLPLAVMSGYALFARGLQQSAGFEWGQGGFTATYRPELAWSQAVRPGLPDRFLTNLYVVGGVAVLPLLARGAWVRRAFGLMVLLVFAVIFAPWSYDLIVVDLLDIEWFSYRLLWAIPVAFVVGSLLASLDGRRGLRAMTALAAAVGLGLSGPDLGTTQLGAVVTSTVDVRDAPDVWPWEAGIPRHLVTAAEAIAAATPEGGRFLAPPRVEEVAMAVQLRAVPTYGRDIYVIPLGRADFAPPDFGLDDRLLLMRGMASSAPEVDQHSWARALESLEVATVCTTSLVEPRLLAAVEQGYSSLGSAGACRDIWVRG